MPLLEIACNLGMCPDGESNRGLLVHRVVDTSDQDTALLQGISGDYDKMKLVKAFKMKLAWNGTAIEHPEYGEVIQLQGDQRKNIYLFLVETGLAKDDQLKLSDEDLGTLSPQQDTEEYVLTLSYGLAYRRRRGTRKRGLLGVLYLHLVCSSRLLAAFETTNPSRHNAFKSRQHVSCRIPGSSCFLSATAGSAANIPETPIGPHPGRARGGAQPLIGRPLSMKRPRRFLRGTAALVCAGASEAKGAAGGQRAPGAGPGTCGAAGAGLRAPISPRPRQTSRRLRNQPGSLA
ncbi:hypothetical protein QTO34_001220 [Cnephaeus nilssonii]|uniref:SUI1 domain-containing protein n=1 Tax=Cnephaeus nilssonii TaxID=3371016 RepID=A0AA40HVJ8_CNENI|nr:hypothetical protein QTO34_001220 [Eptesicus nilssonii]